MPFDIEAAKQRLTRGFPLVNDHPDVAGVLRDPELLALLGPALAHPFSDEGVTVVLAAEARGPIVGGLVAVELGAGLVLARKETGNHPGADTSISSQPTWRGRPETFQGRSFDVGAGDRVLIVDDWVTTGSTLGAMSDFATARGAVVVGAAVLVNKATAETLRQLAVHHLVDFDDLVAGSG